MSEREPRPSRSSFACGRIATPPATRREFLDRVATGFGALAFASLFAKRGESAGGPLPAHHPPRVRSVIFLYMDGGPSQVDTFDPKPRLARESGAKFAMKIEPTQFDDVGATLGSPWKFRRYGRSGLEVSDLFPHVGRHADRLCVIRSMVSEFSEHTNANYFLHTGHGLAGRPAMGAWLSYGLGSANRDLPGFVVVNGGLVPPGGLDCFGAGFLPASHQGSMFKPAAQPVANVVPTEASESLQRRKLDLVRRRDLGLLARIGGDDGIESAIANHELAFRMQAAVPELVDLAGEPAALKRCYGLESEYEPTRLYAAQCLLARRLVERGVRFVELTCPRVAGADRWDQHHDLKTAHENNARAVDQPIAALLDDLAARGLLDETLVLFSGEFGRTPFAQGRNGRDHNPFGFSCWLAGGGVRGGLTYGATDEYGYKAIENRVEIHDLHATILHLLGIEHTKLTYRFSGRDMRLTDVKGHVIHDILA
jgi:hypothetical protein